MEDSSDVMAAGDGLVVKGTLSGKFQENLVQPAKALAGKYPIQVLVYSIAAVCLTVFLLIRCYKARLSQNRRQRRRRRKPKAYYQIGKK